MQDLFLLLVGKKKQWNKIQAIYRNEKCCDVTKQEVCGVMGRFLLASVTWWSPGTTYHSHRRRISTTDTRWAVSAK